MANSNLKLTLINYFVFCCIFLLFFFYLFCFAFVFWFALYFCCSYLFIFLNYDMSKGITVLQINFILNWYPSIYLLSLSLSFSLPLSLSYIYIYRERERKNKLLQKYLPHFKLSLVWCKWTQASGNSGCILLISYYFFFQIRFLVKKARIRLYSAETMTNAAEDTDDMAFVTNTPVQASKISRPVPIPQQRHLIYWQRCHHTHRKEVDCYRQVVDHMEIRSLRWNKTGLLFLSVLLCGCTTWPLTKLLKKKARWKLHNKGTLLFRINTER